MSQDEKKNPWDKIKDRDKKLDDFWDIDRLLPQKPKQPQYTPMTARKTPEAVEVEIQPARPEESNKEIDTPMIRTITVQPAGSVPLSFEHGEKKVIEDHVKPIGDVSISPSLQKQSNDLVLSYVPDSRLIHRVEVYDWNSNYHYFDQFIKDALVYATLEGKEAPRESFFSYFPQYAQLKRRQRAWYLYWRSQVKLENYLETDYAYILLYLFELINLPDDNAQTAADRRDMIAKLWVAYRKAYPQLDHYACEWLCDYCLIHELPAPVGLLTSAWRQILSASRLKEFYLSSMVTLGDDSVNITSARILLAHCCHYDYKKSKFYAEHRDLYDSIIPQALGVAFHTLFKAPEEGEKDELMRILMPDTQVTRDAYTGALCAFSNKRRIKVSYMSFSRFHDLQYMVGDMVKHIENRIRASLLIRSKLTINALAVSLRRELDAWLDLHLKTPTVSVKKIAKDEPAPAYEAFYDLPRTQVSIESADAIEKSSWETTRILVETFADEEGSYSEEETLAPKELSAPEMPPVEAEVATNQSTPGVHPASDHPLLEALGDRVDFILAVLRGDRAGQKAYCASHKKLPDAVIDEINNLTVEQEIYDMILATDDLGNCRVIEDYREMVAELLQT